MSGNKLSGHKSFDFNKSFDFLRKQLDDNQRKRRASENALKHVQELVQAEFNLFPTHYTFIESGGVTYCITQFSIGDSSTKFAATWAICSPSDVYDPSKGKKEALLKTREHFRNFNNKQFQITIDRVNKAEARKFVQTIRQDDMVRGPGLDRISL